MFNAHVAPRMQGLAAGTMSHSLSNNLGHNWLGGKDARGPEAGAEGWQGPTAQQAVAEEKAGATASRSLIFASSFAKSSSPRLLLLHSFLCSFDISGALIPCGKGATPPCGGRRGRALLVTRSSEAEVSSHDMCTRVLRSSIRSDMRLHLSACCAPRTRTLTARADK